VAKVVDAAKLKAPSVLVPGLKPPVHSFAPQDREAPQEADAFRRFVRELRREDHPSFTTPRHH
jgi:hypothetical protein